MLNVFHMWSSALILFYILRFVAFAVSIRHINKTVWNVKDQRVIKTLRARNYTSHRREHSTPTEGLKWKILVGCLWDVAGRCKVCFTSSSQTSQPTANYSLTAANKCKWLKVKARNFLPHHFVNLCRPAQKYRLAVHENMYSCWQFRGNSFTDRVSWASLPKTTAYQEGQESLV